MDQSIQSYYIDIAKKVSEATQANSYGVYTYVATSREGYVFVITGSDTNRYELACSATNEARLTAHVKGFIEAAYE